jgi:putative ABC transport system substrate-binding protein
VKNRSRLTTAAAAAAIAALGLAGCGDTAGTETPADGGQTYQIAITQFLAHPSLDAITQGFKDALADKGLKAEYTYDDAQGDQANTATIAGKYAADSDLDLIMAVATPSAQAVVNQERDRPVLFAGVTEPVEAGLVPSWEASGTNVTGTSDLNPEGKPAALIEEIMGQGKVKTIGFPYSLGEKNSEVQLEALRVEAEALGMAVKESGIASSSELATGVQVLADVDVIFVGTDNAVVTGIEQVVAFGQENQIPVFVADAASVERGAVATRGIDYYQLGRRTGEMAYQILVEGTPPGEIPTLQVVDTEVVANPEAAERFGLTIPEAIAQNATIVATTSESS